MQLVPSIIQVPSGSPRVAATAWGRRLSILLIIALCLGAATGAHAQTPGNPDPGFTAGSNGSLSVLGLQMDGRILLGGFGHDPVRVNPDGTPDHSYGTGGFDSTPAAQPDGKVLAVVQDLLYRTNIDGSEDTFFPDPYLPSGVEQIIVQPDGRIVVVSNAAYPAGPDPSGGGELTGISTGVRRYLTDGTPDSSFTSGLTQVVVVNHLSKLSIREALQPNGQILVSDPLTGFHRLNVDGSVDTGFNASTYNTLSLAVQPDGKILVGLDNTDNANASSLIRLNADGSVDTGFNAIPVNTATTGAGAMVTALAVQPDGKILVGGLFGQVNGVAENNFARLNADGSVDTTFVGPGYGNVVNSVLLQPDGKVLVEGVAGVARYYAYTPVTTSAMAAGTVGQPFTYQITANAAPASFTASPLPAGLSLDAATGVISGTPTNAGIFQITLGTLDASGTSTGFGTLTLTIAAIPVIPVITSDPTASTLTGQTVDYRIRASNLPTSFGASGLPEGMAVAASTGYFYGTTATPGTYAVTVFATNSAGTGTATLSLTVELSVNPTPRITSPTQATAYQGQPFSYQITASDSPMIFGAYGLPDGLTVDNTTGLISGVPTSAGTYSVELQAENMIPDGYTEGTATLTLTVIPPLVTALPVATLVAKVPAVTTGTDNVGEFTLSLSPAPTSDVVVNFTIKGTAVDGTDYVFLKATKKIKAGKTSKPIKVVPLGDGGGAGVKHTVVLTLLPGEGYTVGTTGKVKVRIFGQ